ncbi:MAG: subclass B1 metallo-beta-lactamase [Clostridia bacterium]|nr:subclass B1 metallo-beta-lactamase [Clostridia bacterium]
MNRRKWIIGILLALAMMMSACSGKGAYENTVTVEESILRSGTNDQNTVELKKMNDHMWIHTSYMDYQGNKTPSNGMVVLTSKGLVLVDTPWNDEQTRELIKLAEEKFKEDFVMAIITHAHDDRIGGINTLLENNIEVKSTALTANLAEKVGFKRPNSILNEKEEEIQAGNTMMEMLYPGEGHSKDNITVWFSKEKVLFGGCLIKSDDAKDLGSIKDANIKEWPVSVRKVLERYGNAVMVVPGHGNHGNINLLHHTLELLSKGTDGAN